tara:strand:- start:1847 stop:2230 length:384 start_codon:yes stop_codon:yes gene_type:complete
MGNYTITATIVVIYVIVLIIVEMKAAYDRYKENKELTFPPWTSQCPDYWQVVGPNKCKNTFNMGKPGIYQPTDAGGKVLDEGVSKSCNASTIEFTGEGWEGDKEDINKCKWAKKCMVAWDGMDNKCA